MVQDELDRQSQRVDDLEDMSELHRLLAALRGPHEEFGHAREIGARRLGEP